MMKVSRNCPSGIIGRISTAGVVPAAAIVVTAPAVVMPAFEPAKWKSPSAGRHRFGNVPLASTPGSAGANAADG